MKSLPLSLLLALMVLATGLGLPRGFTDAEDLCTPLTLSCDVYADGGVLVDYRVQVDPTAPRVNITLFGEVLEDLLVVEEQGLPLTYALSNGSLAIDSLGAEAVGITYVTHDLTGKAGRFWTLRLTASTITGITLPLDAHIVSLNRVPDVIETGGSQIHLVFAPGIVEVTYVVGVVGSREYAQIVLHEAAQTISQIQGLGINVSTAEIKLQEAYHQFDLGNYGPAESLGYDARSLALHLNQTASQALQEIGDADTAITAAEAEGRVQGLADARALLSQAETAYALGDYEHALSLAKQAQATAAAASTDFPLHAGLAAVGAIAASSLLLYVYKGQGTTAQTRESAATESMESGAVENVDVEKILKRYDLREAEQRAIHLLADRGGHLFEAELYQALGLPRTSTWRLVRRLEGMGIVDVQKFRDQNRISVRKRYMTRT